MSYFEFTKRFPDKTSAINFIVAAKYKNYGIFHHVSVKHMQRYVDEFCFRLNNRDYDDAFLKCVGMAVA